MKTRELTRMLDRVSPLLFEGQPRQLHPVTMLAAGLYGRVLPEHNDASHPVARTPEKRL